VSILPLEAKNGKIVLAKHLPLIPCKKRGLFFKNWGDSLGKIPQNQGQLLPLPKSGEILHGTYPKTKIFCPICKNST